ncbi:MAG: TRAP transporter small permease [Bacteroidota bacterium]
MFGKILTAGTLISTLALLASVVIQIYGRFFMESAPSWTEEAARVFFIYTMSFGAGLALRDGEFVQLDILFNSLDERWKKRFRLGFAISTLILFIVTGVWSVDYMRMGLNEQSPSMGFSMAIPFAGITVMAIAVSWYSISEMVKLIKGNS